MPRKNTQRLTLDVGEQSFARIEKLQALMEDGTKTAVVQSALQLLEYMVGEVQGGSRFLVQLPNGATERVQILGLVDPANGSAAGSTSAHAKEIPESR